MIRVEETIRNDNRIPVSIRWTSTDQLSPEAKTGHAGLVRDMAAREPNLSGSQLVVGCVCSLGAAKVLLRALWPFEPQCPILQAFPIPRSDCFCFAPLLLSLRRFKLKAVGKGNSRCN